MLFKRIIIMLILISITLSSIPSYAMAEEYNDDFINFINMSTKDGLSQSFANTIYQDSLGYIWIGTTDGLNRYNGHTFKKYQLDTSKQGSISSGHITTITEDNEKNLWVGTVNGLNKLDRKTDKFTSFHPENSNISHYSISEIKMDNNENLWVATLNDVNKYNPKDNKFTNVLKDKGVIDYKTRIYSIEFDNNGLLWIGTNTGILIYDINNDNIIKLDASIEKEFKDKYIRKLFFDKEENYMWIATYSDGLYKYDYNSNAIDRILEKELSNTNIRDILKCNLGNIWVGTSAGLYKYNEEKDKLTIYKNNRSSNNTIISNNILDLLQDRNGLIWVGTVAGISRFNSKSIFTNYVYDETSDNSLNEKIISGLYEDDDGILWVNTFNNGLNTIDRKNNKVYKYVDEYCNSQDVELWTITGIGELIYVATSKGLIQLNKVNGNINVINTKKYPNLSNDNIRKLYVDKDDLLWIGTIDGISTLDKNGNMVNYTDLFRSKGVQEIYISSIHQDLQDDNIMWFGSAINGGLIKYNKVDKSIKVYNNDMKGENKSLSVNSIKSIDEDYEGNIWIATNYGLNKLNKKTEEITIYTEEDGLSNNFIYAALADAKGNIWCSTNNGISRLDAKTQEISNFTMDDGIACNEFNSYSYFKNKDGEMFFGGIDGLTTFNPLNFKEESFDSEIIVDSFTIRNLEKIMIQDEILLNYHQNTFEVEFFMNDYKNNNNKKYFYKLEGFDKEWNDNGNRNYITYTNIPPGNYVLKIKGRNSIGKWVEESTYKINIANTPWKTPVAYACYIILAILIIYVIFNKVKLLEQLIRQRTHELNLKLSENQFLYDKLIQHERYKNNYFVNLSHELRTPLNVIVSTEQLIAQLNKGESNIPKEKLAEYMNGVRGNANRLLNLINNIIDTSRIEAGSFQIDKKQEDIVSIVEETTLSLGSLAEKKQISLIVDPEIEEKLIMCDKYNIERCITNLVGNALKFTPSGGEVIVIVEDLQDKVKIRVKDTGIGIDKKYHKAIFDRFGQAYSQASEVYGGSGLGLTLTSQIVELHNGSIDVISELNKGAEFIITLPVN